MCKIRDILTPFPNTNAMSVTSASIPKTESHTFVVHTVLVRSLVMLVGLFSAGFIFFASGRTAEAVLLPSISSEQLGRAELTTQTTPIQPTTLSRGAAARTASSPLSQTASQVEARDVSARAELGVPEQLKSDLEPTKPTNPAPRSAIPKKVTYKYIVVDLSEQRVYAKEDGVTVFTALISSGLTGPTPVGRFKIYARYYNTCMSGPGYNLCNIHFTQYFTGPYSIHEAWWHNNFGHPMSHGCVNMSYDTSKFFWYWANYGTDVYIQN